MLATVLQCSKQQTQQLLGSCAIARVGGVVAFLIEYSLYSYVNLCARLAEGGSSSSSKLMMQ